MPRIYGIDGYDPLNRIGYLLGRVRAELFAALSARLALDELLCSLELSVPQVVIIMTLATETITPGDLCERISYDPGGMTRMLDRLHSKGLIRRRRCPKDRRRVYLALTAEAEARLPRMRETSIRVLNQFLRGFTKAEALHLESYLTRLLANAQSDGLAVRAQNRSQTAPS